MSKEAVSAIRLTLFKHSEHSFLATLDEAGISHERIQVFSTQPQASGIVETISTLSEAMPWNAIAKVIVAWIGAKMSREVIITTEDGKVIHAKGYSALDVQKFLQHSVNIMVIDTKPSDEI